MTKKATRKMTERGASAKVDKGNSTFRTSMEIFVAGCLMELWLLLIYRFYINGKIEVMLSFDSVLQTTLYVGLALFLLGAVSIFLAKTPARRKISLWLVIAGVFFAASAWLRFSSASINMLSLLVPVLTLLGLAFLLYHREFFWSASILGGGVFALWICRKGIGNMYWNSKTIAGAVVLLVFLVAALLAFRKAEKSGGMLGKLRILPSGSSYPPVYAACTLSAASLALALVNISTAYYAMWALALCIFALAVYYTVKQL